MGSREVIGDSDDVEGTDPQPILLSLKLAAVTVVILIIVGTPLAWWLAFTRNRWRVVIEALTGIAPQLGLDGEGA